MVMVFAKLYPVAIVNGSPIWYRAWDRHFRGTVHALTMQARSAGAQFDVDANMISAIKKKSLNTLIEDTILAQAGSTLIPKLIAYSNQKVHDAMATSSDIEKAALFMYGFNAADFHDFVLLPQSRREVIQDEFDKKKINVAAWFAGVKKKTRVRLIINPYIWDGDTIK